MKPWSNFSVLSTKDKIRKKEGSGFVVNVTNVGQIKKKSPRKVVNLNAQN